jgi:hypothetical protein
MSEVAHNEDRTTTDDTSAEPEPSEATDAAGMTNAADGTDSVSGADAVELAGQLDVLAEENRRLRDEYARARRTRYRRSALGLAVLGTLAALAGVAFPDTRTVLFALAGTGLFAGVLTYYLTPERFLAAAIGRDVYASLADNEADLVTELGLQETAVYVPCESASTPPAWLFVPHRSDYEVPDDDALEELFVVTETERSRGVSFRPSSAPLHEEFDRALADDLATEPAALADQLTEGLVEQFELADSATTDVDPEGGRVSIGISGSAYGPLDRFDHPIESFLGVGFARGLTLPVTVETTPADDRADILVTCRWSA